MYETPHTGLVYLVVKGDPGSNSNDTNTDRDTDCRPPEVPSVTISFTCDRKHGLGYPSKIVSSPCSAHFAWPTIAACSSEPPSKDTSSKDTSSTKETSSKNILSKCYTYDSNGEIRDLSPLIADDGYEVLSPPPVNSSVVSKKLFINVCSEVRKLCRSSRSSSYGTAVCSITAKGEDWRRATIDHLAHVRKSSLHYDEDSDEVILTYQQSSVIDYTCTHQTHIRFRCPSKSADVNIYGLESRKPFLVSSSDCETVIEWETDHACPLHRVKGNMSTCVIEGDDVRIDLSPLRRLGPIIVPNIKSPDLNGSLSYNASISICGSFPSTNKPCPKSDWQSDSVCITGSDGTQHLIGSKSHKQDAELGYRDGRITLFYPTNLHRNLICKEKDASPVTTVTFICDKDTEAHGSFLSVNQLCEFDFEIRTKHACLPPHLEIPVCSLEHNGSLFDLSPLKKKSHEYLWTVSVNPSSFTSAYVLSKDERILLNLCGAIPKATRNTGTCIDLPPTSAACLYNGRTKQSRNIGQFLNPPVYDPVLKAINVTYETSDVKSETSDVKSETSDVKRKKTITTITLKCAPGILDSSPVLVSRSENVSHDSFNLEWSTSAACPLKTSFGSDCIVTDDSLGYTFDLNPLRTDDPIYVEWNKYKFYLNICGELPYNPCKDKDPNAGVCQVDTRTNEAYVSGQANGNVTYYDGVLKLKYLNGTKYRDPQRTPRTAEIAFICDEEHAGDGEHANVRLGKGRLEMVTESNRTYFFRWYTKYACPDFENIVPCLWTNGTHSVDLSPISLVDSNHFEVSGIKRSTGAARDRYYANICRPLNPIREPKSCRKGTAVCWYSIDSNGTQTVTSLGIPSTPPTFHDGDSLSILYKNGDPCFIAEEKKNTTWSSMIIFLCDHSNSEAEFKIIESGDCYKKIQMKTDLVCNISTKAPTVVIPSGDQVPTKYDTSGGSSSGSGSSSDHKKPGIIIVTVIALLVILFAIFILVNREVR